MRHFIVSLIVIIFEAQAFAQEWDHYNNPFKLGKNFSTEYSSLPLRGEVKDKRTAWPANHWPNNVGGIAHRWSSGDPKPFSYRTYRLSELRRNAPHELAMLSPAEKFDIYRRDYNYTLTRKVLKENSPRENHWHGLCHGVAPATIHHAEPDFVTLTNKDGIKIEFYSSDVAALMAYYYAKVGKSKVTLVGRRCYKRDPALIETAPSCRDINPGSFHVILANLLGQGKTFVADTERKNEVWNHVAVSFESIILGQSEVESTSSPQAIRRLRMETNVTYAAAIAQKFYPVLGTSNAEYLTYTYEYFLDLDPEGRIVGGEWIGYHRPDFVWVQGKLKFENDWSILKDIYRPVQN